MTAAAPSADRDERTGRFLTGSKGGPGRKPGSRNKLGEQYLADLAEAWQRHGVTALERTALEEPATFCKIIASLLPRDVALNITHDVTAFAATFEAAVAMLGNTPQPQRRSLPGQPKLIEVGHVRQRR